MFNGNQSPQTAKYQDLKSAMLQMLQPIRVKVFPFQSATQMVIDFFVLEASKRVVFFCSVHKTLFRMNVSGFPLFLGYAEV